MAKRRVAILKLLHRVPDAISALITLLDISPTDVEAWTELSNLYLSQGLYAQAIFALEEVLLLAPNDHNVSTLRLSITFLPFPVANALSKLRLKC